jgi:hypothetical protein
MDRCVKGLRHPPVPLGWRELHGRTVTVDEDHEQSYPPVTIRHMGDLEERHLIGKARLLRREGKTYDEIRALIGPHSDDKLRAWLKGIPRPPGTNRTGRALPEVRRRVRELRAQGRTIGEISAITGASKGSISPWIRDIRIPNRVVALRQAHLDELRGRGAQVLHERAVARSRERSDIARREVGALSDRELLFVGTALYWAEGNKDKPWKRHGRVKLINSDPSLLRVYLAWLHLIGVASSDIRYCLSIHESVDVGAQERWWRSELGLQGVEFQRAWLKRHNPKPRRHNTAETYHGCLVVTVVRSRALYDAIEGWWGGIVHGCEAARGGRPVPLL